MKKYFDKLKKKFDESEALDRVLIGGGKAVDIVERAADILVHIGPDMSLMGGVALGSRVVAVMRDSRLVGATEHFEKEGWVPLNLYGFEAQAWRFAHAEIGVKVKPVQSTYADEQAYVIEGLGVDIGFTTGGGANGIRTNHSKLKAESCWVRTEAERESALTIIGRGLWKNIGSTKALLIQQDNGIAVIPDDEEETLPSRRGDEVHDKLKRYLDQGVHRSVFMIGEAGVGKSHMLRYIAGKFGGLTLRVKIADLEEISPTKMVKTVELLRPDSFIIDDFDRFVIGSRYADEGGRGNKNVGKMLDPLQHINRMVKLFMVSANYSDGINEAVLRPGRFDELVQVHELDPDLYAKMLPDAPAKLIKALKKKKPPIAYVAELKKRVDVLGYAEASKEMDDLMRRSGRIIELNDKKLSDTEKNKKIGSSSLVGKTKYKQALIMDKRAAKLEKDILKAREVIQKSEDKAQEWRDKAEEARKKAVEEKAASDKKAKSTKTKKVKKKAKAKAASASTADKDSSEGLDLTHIAAVQDADDLMGRMKKKAVKKKSSVSLDQILLKREINKLSGKA